MRILLTGAFGNIGSSTLLELLQQGHIVRCFARKHKATEQKAKVLAGRIELVWGDVRRAEDVQAAVQDQEIIVHLASILPPQVDRDLETAREINVGGTHNLLEAAKKLPQQPRILFSSSLAVFGYTQDQPPPRKINDPVGATDAYTEHKLVCEEMIKTSGLTWSIFRFSIVPLLVPRRLDPIMFRIPLDTRIEVLHPYDAGRAIANGVLSKEIWEKTLLIGGGVRCQIHYRAYLKRSLETLGISMLPDSAFGTEPYYTDWMDTEESQYLLNYQRYSFDDIIHDQAKKSHSRKLILMPIKPVIRWWLLRKSPYMDGPESALQ
jgi:nucleoside-diphosphate-sugar epimerase